MALLDDIRKSEYLSLLGDRLQGLLDIPTNAARFMVNPTAVVDAVSGKTAMPREKGFAEGLAQLPQTENLSVLDPRNRAYMEGYSQGEPFGYAAALSPFAASGATRLSDKLVQTITGNPMATGAKVIDYASAYSPTNITAWHGSPYQFNKFDMSKVGTGEGAQSYGYGMYFAENPAVAKQYQAALSDTKYFADGKQLKGDDAWAAQFLHDFQYDALPKKVDVNTAVAKANEILKAGEAREQIVNKIKQLDKTGVSVESGSLYKVDIPDEKIPKMLDWDKPFKEQSKDVQSVLKEINPNISENDVGRVIYESFARPSKMIENSPMIEFMRNNPELTPQAAASKFLNEKGIKGIRYLDEGSRIAPKYTGDPAFIYAGNSFKENGYTLEEAFEGMKQAYKNEDFKEIKDALGEVYGVKPNQTSNFVVFEPTDVKMLERNNKPVEGLLD